jgi:hypothetical protein
MFLYASERFVDLVGALLRLVGVKHAAVPALQIRVAKDGALVHGAQGDAAVAP